MCEKSQKSKILCDIYRFLNSGNEFKVVYNTAVKQNPSAVGCQFPIPEAGVSWLFSPQKSHLCQDPDTLTFPIPPTTRHPLTVLTSRPLS